MNWNFILSCFTFGLLFALYAAGMAVMAADNMPSTWGWVKIGAGSAVALVIGVFTYVRNPQGAWQQGPGGKP